MNSTRRSLLLGTVLGAGYVGLRSLATGLSPAWLLGGAEARADEPADGSPPSFLILATSGNGDPVNANCPGSYVPGVDNNPHPELAPTTFALGSKTTRGAKCWSLLPDDLRARMAFFHHRTYTNAHPEHPKTMAAGGAAKSRSGNGSEMLASLFASEAAGPLGTIQREPIALGGELVTFEGRPLQNVDPASLRSLFDQPEDLPATLGAMRDREIDTIYRGLRESGTPAQRKFMDRFALGRDQARKLGGDLIALLQRLPPETEDGSSVLAQVIAAVALIKLKVAPVITIHLPFGGDNHGDADLAIEQTETVAGVAAIGALWQELKREGLQDQVSFAMLNVFGRSLRRNPAGGRNHLAGHHVTPMFGKRFRPGVIGGIQDGVAGAIDAATGEQRPSGDIPAEESLEACAKTLGAGLGFDREMLARRIVGGKIVEAAVAG